MAPSPKLPVFALSRHTRISRRLRPFYDLERRRQHDSEHAFDRQAAVSATFTAKPQVRFVRFDREDPPDSKQRMGAPDAPPPTSRARFV
jgi:hypothetical protein